MEIYRKQFLDWPWARCKSCRKPRNNPPLGCPDMCSFHLHSLVEEKVRHFGDRIRFWYCVIAHKFERFDFCCIDGDYGEPHECIRGALTLEEAKETISSLAWAIGAKVQRGEAYIIAETWAENTAWALTQAAAHIERLDRELAEARKSA